MKDRKFGFVCDREEQEILTVMAQHLQRSRGDVVRLLIREEAKRLHITPRSRGKAVEIEDSYQGAQSQSRNVLEDGVQPSSQRTEEETTR